MTGGKHVSRAVCSEMRRLYEETEYTAKTIAHELGGYHEDTVRYHVDGRCSHPDG
jgi:predicted transcriptional regulator